jgi:hypothetical protein
MEDAMTALKSLTFTTLPKIGANPTMDRRANIVARLEEQSCLCSNRADVGEKGWATNAGRQAATRVAVVAFECQRVLCLLRSIRLEANRVRKGQDRNRRSVARQNPGGDRHPHHGGAQRRTGRAVGAGQQAEGSAQAA